jgi:hypothetical protein
MVKTGSDRSDKYSAKYDPKAIMYRLKAIAEKMKQDFQNACLQHEIVDLSLEALKELLDLAYGQFGDLSDLLKANLWIFGEYSGEDIEFLHQQILAKGYTEEEWLIILEWLGITNYRVKTVFGLCLYPSSKLFSLVEVHLNQDVVSNEG